MKNVNYKYFFLIILSMLLFSCGDDDKSSTEPEFDQALVGTWELTKVFIDFLGQQLELTPEQAQISSTVTFNSDGSFEATSTELDSTTVDTGTWKTSDGVVTISIQGDEPLSSPYTLEGNTVTIVSTVPYQGAEIPATLEFTKRM